MLVERREQTLGCLGGMSIKRPHVALEQADKAHRRRRANRGDAPTRRQDGHLPDDVPSSDLVNRFLAPEDLGVTGLDYEERVAEVTLGHDHLSGCELAVEGYASNRSEVGLGQTGKRGDRSHARDVH